MKTFLLSFLATVIFFAGCAEEKAAVSSDSGKPPERIASESEYKLVAAELNLAASEKAYVCLDIPRSEVSMKVKGAIVWNRPFTLDDPGTAQKFVNRFRGTTKMLVRPLTGKQLFDSQARFPDSLLAIVTKALEVDPNLLQRELPSRFRLMWGQDLILDIRTDIKVESKSAFRDVLVSAKDVFGNTVLVAHMAAEDALTLYRAVQPGTPTLLISEDIGAVASAK